VARREVRRSTPEEMPLQAKKAFNKTTPFRDFRDWRHTVQVERFEIWWLPVAHEKIRAFLFFASSLLFFFSGRTPGRLSCDDWNPLLYKKATVVHRPL
jgi:hypothetical protein